MACEVEYTDEFEIWWQSLTAAEQGAIDGAVRALEQFGADLPFPRSSRIKTSKHSRLRELRVQAGGRPIRVLYAFNPSRTAILLLGGDKTGNDRWYEQNVPIADRLYDQHLVELKRESKGESSG